MHLKNVRFLLDNVKKKKKLHQETTTGDRTRHCREFWIRFWSGWISGMEQVLFSSGSSVPYVKTEFWTRIALKSWHSTGVPHFLLLSPRESACSSCIGSRVFSVKAFSNMHYFLNSISWDDPGLRSLPVSQPCLGNQLFVEISQERLALADPESASLAWQDPWDGRGPGKPLNASKTCSVAAAECPSRSLSSLLVHTSPGGWSLWCYSKPEPSLLPGFPYLNACRHEAAFYWCQNLASKRLVCQRGQGLGHLLSHCSAVSCGCFMDKKFIFPHFKNATHPWIHKPASSKKVLRWGWPLKQVFLVQKHSEIGLLILKPYLPYTTHCCIFTNRLRNNGGKTFWVYLTCILYYNIFFF